MSLPDEELLSAYLDGELTGEERSRVERWLADSPDARQLLDELRSLKTSLERMPRARLGHDFAEHVLRHAEREVLTGDVGEHAAPIPTSASAKKIESAARVERLSGLSWQRLRRPVIWASLTLAAGLLIMFVERDFAPPGGKQVAMAPAEVRQRDRGELVAPAGEAENQAEQQAENQPLPARQDPDEKTVRYGRPETRAGGAAEPELALPAAPAAPESRAADAPADARGGRKIAAGKPMQLGSEKDVDQKQKVVEEKTRNVDSDKDGMQDSLPVGSEPLIVWCVVAAGTDYRNSFQELLAKEDIQFQDDRDLTEAEGFGFGADMLKAKLAQKAEEPESRLREPAKRGRQKVLADAEQAVADPNTEVVLVEASPQQVEALLEAIDDDSQVYVNIEFEPSPNAPREVQQLQRYARGYAGVDKLGEVADEGAKLEKKKAEPSSGAPAEKAASSEKAGARDRSERTAGQARRLMLRTSAEPDESSKRPEAKTEELPPLAQSREAKKGDAMKKAPVEFRSTLAAGLGGMAQRPSSDRLQVLFVLHPQPTPEAASEAKPAEGK